MRTTCSYAQQIATLTLLPIVVGCFGGLPAVKPPAINVEAAAQTAVSEFDADGDGAVSKNEACMGMATTWDRYDQDGDGLATTEEIQSRFSKWTDGDTGMMNMRVELRFRGQPLPDANVTMTPFEFLGENMHTSEGVTDTYGYAFMAVPQERLPKSQENNYGMQVGLFKVSITHPDRKIPEKYNVATELSVDLSPDEANTGVRFNLK